MSRENADEEVTVVLTRAEAGVAISALRMRRAKNNKSARQLAEKFGDEAVLPTERIGAASTALAKIEEAMGR